MSRGSSVTVAGNGVAGYACAARLAEQGVPVTLIGPGLPCDRPPLSKRALITGRVPYLADTAALEAAGITHLDGWASAVDLGRRELRFTPRAGRGLRTAGFDTLVWATGLRLSLPPVQGIEAVQQNADPAGFASLLRLLARPARRVAVLGAGLIGTETAATLSRSHRVTLIDRSRSPLHRLHPAVSAAAWSALSDLGVVFAGDRSVERIEPAPGGGHVVHTTANGTFAADVVVAATGVRATIPPELGGAACLDTDEQLAVPGMDGVWACGDAAAFPHPRFGRLTIPHVDNARASGRHVADAILGARTPYTRDPYWFSDLGPLRIQQVGSDTAACQWTERDGLHVGQGCDGRPACVVLLNAPQRLNEARRLVAAA